MALELGLRSTLRAVPALFGAAALAQVLYPLTSGSARDTLTVLIVALVAAASFVHAVQTRGARVAGVLGVVTVAGGFAVEVIATHTGVPFGAYRYSGTLGPRVLGVPVVIAFAWAMLAWPAALAALRLCESFGARVLLGAWALTAWDLFLDPQMVAAGHWRWLHPSPHLPGVPDVPLTDYLGWAVLSLLISVALQSALRGHRAADDRVPLAFYVWTWASSTLALAVLLGLPSAALWGCLAMGTVAVPVARSLAGRR
jgi:uncharacterized membrane protein